MQYMATWHVVYPVQASKSNSKPIFSFCYVHSSLYNRYKNGAHTAMSVKYVAA